LVRDYYKLIDTRSGFKKKLSNSLYISFSGYQKVFSNTCGLVSIKILKKYPTPQEVISAQKQDIIDILLNSRKGIKWAEKKYDNLVEASENAQFVSLTSPWLSVSITTSIAIYEAIDTEIATLLKRLNVL
ncbi:IS110 family transposase, partial [Clostridium estertheticum]|nr:IS110 family transposase [Clostridium estertheticum]